MARVHHSPHVLLMNVSYGGGRLAKGHTRRAALLHELRKEDERGEARALGVDELAETVGLHPNTIREHLMALVKEGLVTRVKASASGRGRPRDLFTAAAPTAGERRVQGASAGDLRDYVLWILASSHGQDASRARQTAREMGRAWGEEARSRSGVDPAEPTHSLVARALEGLGMEPSIGAGGDAVDIGACPVADLAREYPDVMCGVHGAMLEGFCGASDTVTLLPFHGPLMCQVRVRDRAEV